MAPHSGQVWTSQHTGSLPSPPSLAASSPSCSAAAPVGPHVRRPYEHDFFTMSVVSIRVPCVKHDDAAQLHAALVPPASSSLGCTGSTCPRAESPARSTGRTRVRPAPASSRTRRAGRAGRRTGPAAARMPVRGSRARAARRGVCTAPGASTGRRGTGCSGHGRGSPSVRRTWSLPGGTSTAAVVGERCPPSATADLTSSATGSCRTKPQEQEPRCS